MGRAWKRGAVGRSAALGRGAVGDCSGCFGALAGWVGAEVAVLQPVAVALEGEDLGVVDEPVDHRSGDDLVTTRGLPQADTRRATSRAGSKRLVAGSASDGVDKDLPPTSKH